MKLLNILLALSLYSCSSIPDIIACRARSVNEGFCTYTISNKNIIVNDEHPLNGKTWLDIKIESVYLPSDSWAKIKEYILKNCKKDQSCMNNLESLSNKIDSISP